MRSASSLLKMRSLSCIQMKDLHVNAIRFAKTNSQKKTDGISHISHTAKGHTWPYMINLSSEMFHSPRTVNNFIADWNRFY